MKYLIEKLEEALYQAKNRLLKKEADDGCTHGDLMAEGWKEEFGCPICREKADDDVSEMNRRNEVEPKCDHIFHRTEGDYCVHCGKNLEEETK